MFGEYAGIKAGDKMEAEISGTVVELDVHKVDGRYLFTRDADGKRYTWRLYAEGYRCIHTKDVERLTGAVLPA